MKLSVIIVNYNVKYFLEQCLISVFSALEEVKLNCQEHIAEVFVVDNNSVDSSTSMVKQKFPGVHLIENTTNYGFSAANNQAIRVARGEYILLLNPDTVVDKSTFVQCIKFMDENPQAGSLGVRMIDGAGKFLPESKRGFPTPATAFFKISGFSFLFPRSRIFGRYHLGFLNEHEIHEVDVLSGAFMFIRKKVLDQTGLLDEDFFMYGEDIDFSYRIKQAGYKNYYFPNTTIIHYKGESTKKNSINYVFLFYHAMILFARKHFSSKYALIYSMLIKLAIYFRATISVIHRFVKRSIIPLFDILFSYSFLVGIKIFWENNETIGHGSKYPEELTNEIFPIYILLWIVGLAVTSNYQKPYRLNSILKGVFVGTLIISFFYAFLPEYLRYSRALIVLGTFSSALAFLITRLAHNIILNKSLSFRFTKMLRVAIVGKRPEIERISKLLKKHSNKVVLVGSVTIEDDPDSQFLYLGKIEQINEIIDVYRLEEMIFSSQDMALSQIISVMSGIRNKQVTFKLAPQDSLFIIGSNNKNTSGDYYTLEIGLNISQAHHKFNKRLFDILLATILLCSMPVCIWFILRKRNFILNLMNVLIGKLSWVGYSCNLSINNLPKIRQGVLNPLDGYPAENVTKEDVTEINLLYATNYSLLKDLNIIQKNFRELGRQISQDKL